MHILELSKLPPEQKNETDLLQWMRFLGGKRQLLCITHLPQIAAMADNHFLIEKESDAGETVTRVTALDEEGAVREVARLMNDVTETTLAAARELLAEK